jgi:hypothetical protein
VSKPRYITVTLTEKQVRAAESALRNLVTSHNTALMYADMRDNSRQWEREAIYRLRAAMISALRSDEVQP